MVGVPNRRKCPSCRRRKIKCDEERPSCGQCRKGAIVCEGYDAPPVFRNQSGPNYSKNHVAKHYQTAVRSTEIRWRQLETPQRRRDHPRRRGKTVADNTSASVPTAVEVRLQVSRRYPDTPLSPPMPLSSWSHDSLIQDFLDNMLPPTGTKRYCLFSWLRDIISWKEDSDVTRLALTALATGWAGRVDNRPDLVGKGLQMYGVAAHRLCREIPGCKPPLILATTGVFIVYELFEFGPEGNAGCSYHMDGAAASVRAAKALDIAEPPFVRVFDFFRVIFMIRCFQLRRRPNPAEMVWIERPQFSRIQHDEFMLLVKLGYEGVGLIEAADALELGLSHNSPSMLAEAVHQHLQELMKWRDASDLIIQEGPVEALARVAHVDCGIRGFPGRIDKGTEPLAYDRVHDMRLMQMYYTFRLTIFITLLGNPKLRRALSAVSLDWRCVAETSRETGIEADAVAMIIKEADIAANCICSYARILCPTAGPTIGYMFELWALETAIDWYENHADIGRSTQTSHVAHHCMEICHVLIPTIKLQMASTP